MANICEYEVRVLGSKKAGLFVFEAMPSYDNKELTEIIAIGDSFQTRFIGDCKWDIDYGTEDSMDSIDVDAMSESDICAEGLDYWNCSLRAKSKALKCEIYVHSWSTDSEYERYDHYKNGKVLDKKALPYSPAKPYIPASPLCRDMTGSCGELKWRLAADGTLTISGIGRMENYKNGEAPWYEYRWSIRNVMIEAGATTIGIAAFWECSSIASVILPDSLTIIGERSFLGCLSLTNVTIPDSVTTIRDYTFSGCSGLANVTIPDSVTTIARGAFSGCSGLANVTIPNSVTTIGDAAFSGCSGLTYVTIPDSVTYIGGGAFEKCTSLQNITIPSGSTIISFYTFQDCSKLQKIVNIDSITRICDGAFSGCKSLQSIDLSNNLTYLGSNAFSGCRSLQSIDLSNNLTYLGPNAFLNCRTLTVNLPQNYLKTKDVLNSSLASVKLYFDEADIAYIVVYQKSKAWQDWVKRNGCKDPETVLKNILAILNKNKLTKTAVADRIGSYIAANRAKLPKDDVRQVLDYFSAVSSETLDGIRTVAESDSSHATGVGNLPKLDANPKFAAGCAGMIFVITGSVNRFKNRDAFTKYVKSQGGRVSGSVSAKTNYLVNNDLNSPSSKNKTAKALGVPIISEDDFIERFGFEE